MVSHSLPSTSLSISAPSNPRFWVPLCSSKSCQIDFRRWRSDGKKWIFLGFQTPHELFIRCDAKVAIIIFSTSGSSPVLDKSSLSWLGYNHACFSFFLFFKYFIAHEYILHMLTRAKKWFSAHDYLEP